MSKDFPVFTDFGVFLNENIAVILTSLCITIAVILLFHSILTPFACLLIGGASFIVCFLVKVLVSKWRTAS